MRWIQVLFALIALVFLVLWLSSYFYNIEASAPLKKGSGLRFTNCIGRLSVGVSHGGAANHQSDVWGIGIISVKTLRENIQSVQDVGIDMESPEEYLSYGYTSFNLSDPGGKWTWSGADFTIPTWLPVVLFGLWPVIASARHDKRRYFTHGVCRKCGYDLRGTPSGGCPECGNRAKSGGRETI